METIEIKPDQRIEDVVTIGYLDLMESRENRRMKLSDHYYFSCGCQRCLDPDTDAAMYSVRCQNDGGPVYVGMAGAGVEELRPEKCKKCGWKPAKKVIGRNIGSFNATLNGTHFPSQLLEHYVRVCSSSRQTLDLGDSEVSVSVPSVDSCLDDMTGLLHPDHFLYTRAAKRAFEQHVELW